MALVDFLHVIDRALPAVKVLKLLLIHSDLEDEYVIGLPTDRPETCILLHEFKPGSALYSDAVFGDFVESVTHDGDQHV